MRTYMIYLLLTGKRLLRQLPYFLAGLAVMVLLVGMAAFSASKVLYGETSLKKIEVGVVLPEDDALSEKITKMIASLDSVESLCDFSYLEHDEAFQKMKSGELQAVFEVPSGMARGILDGTNQPATIWFPDESGLEGAVFRELAESGSSMLGTSQAAIYAADEYLNLQGVPEQISVSEQDLNRIFLKYAMNREALFRKKTVSAAGNVSTAVFYGISGIVFLMILTGIPAAPFLAPQTEALEQGLRRIGIRRWYPLFCKCLCMTLLLMAVTAGGYGWAVKKGYALAGREELAAWGLTCAAVSAWILLFYEVCRSSAAAILTLFAVNVVFLFLAGGIIPSVFLPELVQKVGNMTVTALWMDGIRFIASGGETGAVPVLWKLAAAALACFALALAARKKEGLTDAEAGVVVLYVWNDAAAGALPPGVPPVSSDLSIGNGRAPSGGKTGFRADHGGALPGNGCVESGACRKTGIGREPFIFLLSVRDGGRGKEGGYDRTGGVRLPVSREIKRTAGRGALYPCGPRAGVAVHGGRENYIRKDIF